jgi:hypothetical protein
MSIGFDILKSTITYDEDGLPVHDISAARLDHISIVDSGAFEESCCWVAGADHMSRRIRNASLRWRLGVIARDQKRAEDRAMVARYLAAKAAPAPRGPRGKPQAETIPPMPEAMRRAVSMGFSFDAYSVCRRAPQVDKCRQLWHFR